MSELDELKAIESGKGIWNKWQMFLDVGCETYREKLNCVLEHIIGVSYPKGVRYIIFVDKTAGLIDSLGGCGTYNGSGVLAAVSGHLLGLKMSTGQANLLDLQGQPGLCDKCQA